MWDSSTFYVGTTAQLGDPILFLADLPQRYPTGQDALLQLDGQFRRMEAQYQVLESRTLRFRLHRAWIQTRHISRLAVDWWLEHVWRRIT